MRHSTRMLLTSMSGYLLQINSTGKLCSLETLTSNFRYRMYLKYDVKRLEQTPLFSVEFHEFENGVLRSTLFLFNHHTEPNYKRKYCFHTSIKENVSTLTCIALISNHARWDITLTNKQNFYILQKMFREERFFLCKAWKFNCVVIWYSWNASFSHFTE